MSDDFRTRGHIPWRKIDIRLRSLREIWVATSDPRGRPDATPVWFWWDGQSVWFTTKASSRKARNLVRQPAVVLLNGDGADPIILKGVAELVSDDYELASVDAAYHEKYVDPGSGTEATIFVQGDVVFRVRPRLVMAWEYATCSNRTDWEFPRELVGVSGSSRRAAERARTSGLSRTDRVETEPTTSGEWDCS